MTPKVDHIVYNVPVLADNAAVERENTIGLVWRYGSGCKKAPWLQIPLRFMCRVIESVILLYEVIEVLDRPQLTPMRQSTLLL